MIEDKIIDKIKKLLALSASPNENEAQLALEKAQKLMADYCISRNKLYSFEKPLEVISKLYNPPFHPSRGLQKELPHIAGTISRIFGCMGLIQGNRPAIYGFQTNIEIVQYTLDTILNQAIIDYRIGYAKARSITFDESFWKAFSTALMMRFLKHITEGNGLIIYDPVRAHINSLTLGVWNNKTGTDSQSGSDYGQNAGDSVQIVSGIKSGNQGGLLG